MALAAQTQVQCYNRALALLGSVNRTTNIDDGKAVTETLNALWPGVVREVTAEHPWNHAVKRAQLNKQSAADADGGIICLFPADKVRWLPPSPADDDWYDAVEEDGKLLVFSDTPPRIRYIALVSDPSAWPPHFFTAVSDCLAWQAAEAVTQSDTLQQMAEVRYHGTDEEGGSLARAKQADGLASGRRGQGNVVRESRALRAAMGRCGPRAPGR